AASSRLLAHASTRARDRRSLRHGAVETRPAPVGADNACHRRECATSFEIALPLPRFREPQGTETSDCCLRASSFTCLRLDAKFRYHLPSRTSLTTLRSA